jgi:hypothetical protein
MGEEEGIDGVKIIVCSTKREDEPKSTKFQPWQTMGWLQATVVTVVTINSGWLKPMKNWLGSNSSLISYDELDTLKLVARMFDWQIGLGHHGQRYLCARRHSASHDGFFSKIQGKWTVREILDSLSKDVSKYYLMLWWYKGGIPEMKSDVSRLNIVAEGAENHEQQHIPYDDDWFTIVKQYGEMAGVVAWQFVDRAYNIS